MRQPDAAISVASDGSSEPARPNSSRTQARSSLVSTVKRSDSREGLDPNDPDAGGWHLLKSNLVRDWAGREEVSLADLEPLLGLDPTAERTGDQLSLFSG